ncbi:hypothetical protein G6F59_015256 [Rhizopus arrhizus]|nr:hypothetical protein G6F59_015256 [Rhizopus arrhizus]
MAASVASSSRRMCLARNASWRLWAMWAVIRLHSAMCGSRSSGIGRRASWAGVNDTSFSPRARTSSASRRFWLRLLSWNSPVSSSRPRIDKALNVIAPEVAVGDDSPARLERLADLSQQLLDRARALGASQAEVSCSEDRGLEVNVRLGEVETVQSTRDRGIAVTVYFGKRKGSASTGDLNEASLAATLAPLGAAG